jgi:hypothetical protein
MDDGCNDRDFDPSPEAAALIRARLADGHRGLQQLLIDALGYRQAGNGLQREELAALIDERVAREQLGGWYLAALAAQDRAAKAAEDLLEHGCLDDVAHERVATRLSDPNYTQWRPLPNVRWNSPSSPQPIRRELACTRIRCLNRLSTSWRSSITRQSRRLATGSSPADRVGSHPLRDAAVWPKAGAGRTSSNTSE